MHQPRDISLGFSLSQRVIIYFFNVLLQVQKENTWKKNFLKTN